MALKNPDSFEWKALYVVTGTIDAIQILLDFFPEIGGEVINETIDVPIGIILGLYFQLRGVSMIQRISRLLSIVGGDLAEQFSASVAPAWVIDVWYIHKTVKEEWAAQQAASAETDDVDDQPLNRGNVRRPTNIRKPLNQGGARQPNGGI